LHAEKGKPGQYIGKVDEGSPAEAAGLKQGDRIVEVNGVNIANENHKQVVQRIKAISNETKLLVVDAEADKYFKAHNVVIKATLPDVLHLKTPVPNGDEIDMNGEKGDGNCEDLDSHKSERSAASPEPEVNYVKYFNVYSVQYYVSYYKTINARTHMCVCKCIPDRPLYSMFRRSAVILRTTPVFKTFETVTVPDFGRTFLGLNHIDRTKNIYIQS
jgi:hypothetical protein